MQRVAANSPAEAIGLRAGTIPATIDGKALVVGGDVILSVQGIQIESPESYTKIQDRLSTLGSGARVTITVLRDGRLVELSSPLP